MSLATTVSSCYLGMDPDYKLGTEILHSDVQEGPERELALVPNVCLGNK